MGGLSKVLEMGLAKVYRKCFQRCRNEASKGVGNAFKGVGMG